MAKHIQVTVILSYQLSETFIQVDARYESIFVFKRTGPLACHEFKAGASPEKQIIETSLYES